MIDLREGQKKASGVLGGEGEGEACTSFLLKPKRMVNYPYIRVPNNSNVMETNQIR